MCLSKTPDFFFVDFLRSNVSTTLIDTKRGEKTEKKCLSNLPARSVPLLAALSPATLSWPQSDHFQIRINSNILYTRQQQQYFTNLTLLFGLASESRAVHRERKRK